MNTTDQRTAAAVAQDNVDALGGVVSFERETSAPWLRGVDAKTTATQTTSKPTPTLVKHDAGKLPLDLLPFVAVEEVAAVLEFGARKYERHGWRNVDKRSRYFAATLRHLFAYVRGEDRDPESGLRHLAHAACSLLFLLEADVSGLGQDDRPRNP